MIRARLARTEPVMNRTTVLCAKHADSESESVPGKDVESCH